MWITVGYKIYLPFKAGENFAKFTDKFFYDRIIM